MKRHAYLILAHQDRHQLEQLLSLLDHERNDVYLQLDRKGSLCADDFALEKSGLIVLPSYPVYWGGFSFIQAELNLLRAASDNRYHYYHFLTGADLPLVSQDGIHTFLENSESEYVAFAPEYHSFAHWKAAYYHVLVENRLYRRVRIIRFLGHTGVKMQSWFGVDRSRTTHEAYYHGSSYFSITHPLVEYILANEQWVKDTFKLTLACDEVFIQTLLMKSPFIPESANRDSFTGNNLRYIDWGRRVGNSPHTFTMADYEELRKASNDCLFARKFSRRVDAAIVDTIVNRLTHVGSL